MLWAPGVPSADLELVHTSVAFFPPGLECTNELYYGWAGWCPDVSGRIRGSLWLCGQGTFREVIDNQPDRSRHRFRFIELDTAAAVPAYELFSLQVLAG